MEDLAEVEVSVREILNAESPSMRQDHAPDIVNSSFSTTLPTLQIAWDSTSLGALKTCPEFYNLSIRQGYTTHTDNVHLTFGLLAHSGKEMYDRLRIGGLDWRYYRRLRRIGVARDTARRASRQGLVHKAALLCVLRFVLCATWDFKRKRPWISDEPTKNRETLFRALIWYLDQFQDDPMRTYVRADGRPAVELSFRFDSGIETETTGERFIFCGHLDRVAVYQGNFWITDVKTTKYNLDEGFFAKFAIDNQMSMYSLAGTLILHEPVRGVMIDGWQTLATGNRFQRGEVTRTPGQIQEWLLDTAYWLRQAERYATDNHWPKNDKSCISGDTIVTVTRGKRKGWKIPVRKLYDLFHGIAQGRAFKAELSTYLLSDVGGHVGNNLVLNVIQNGKKPVFRISTADGFSIKATSDHKFRTIYGWLEVSELNEGDILFAWGSRNFLKTEDRKERKERRVIGSLYYYPSGWRTPRKGVGLRNRRKGSTQRISRLTVEATMNGMSLEELVWYLQNSPEKSATLKFLPSDAEVHHKDDDASNDSTDNLEVLTVKEHKEIHGMRNNVNKLGTTIITTIDYIGEEYVYDISMDAPYHNFIANGLVAHNCFRFGRFCEFREICSSDPALRAQKLKMMFKKRTWDPLRTREI